MTHSTLIYPVVLDECVDCYEGSYEFIWILSTGTLAR